MQEYDSKESAPNLGPASYYSTLIRLRRWSKVGSHIVHTMAVMSAMEWNGVSTLLHNHVKTVVASLAPQPRSLAGNSLRPGICRLLNWVYGGYSVSVDRSALRSDAY